MSSKVLRLAQRDIADLHDESFMRDVASYMANLSPATRARPYSIALEPFKERFGADWIEQKLPAFGCDLAFLLQPAESVNDVDIAIEAMVALHVGVLIEPSNVLPRQPRPEVFTQRLKYVNAAAGLPYVPEPIDELLRDRVDRLFQRNWGPAAVEARPNLERDLAFLAEAARSQTESLYALAVVAMLHLGVQLEDRGAHGGNTELLDRVDYMFNRAKTVFDRFETVNRRWRDVQH